MPKRPNILLLYTDQQRYDTVHSLGNAVIQTPTLDRLANEGAAFTSAYCASPVCISSRCSLLLGQYAHETGCEDNIPMPQDRVSLMQLLSEAGYQTHGVVKMHFMPDSWNLWGFDSRDYSEEGGFNPEDDFCKSLSNAGYQHVLNPYGIRSEYYYIPQPSQLPQRLHHSWWVADKSLDFLARRKKDQPFFLWSSFIKPHPPFENPYPWNRLYKPVEMPWPFLPPRYEELQTHWNRVQNRYKYKDQGFDGNIARATRAAYFAAISFVDYNAGRILARLEEEGELENTLVIYTSDHGEFLGDYGCWGKRSMLDPAARVPLLARYPERFAAGQQVTKVASAVDVLPTCLEAAGLRAPDDRSGVDLALLARGEADREAVLCQFQTEGKGLYALITDEWKYIWSAPDQKEWLLRRADAQVEATNLAGHPVYQPVVNALRAQLTGRLSQDGYTKVLDGQGWRRYPVLEVSETPDAGQLYQEGGDVEPMLPEGYTQRCNPYKGFVPSDLNFGTRPAGKKQ